MKTEHPTVTENDSAADDTKTENVIEETIDSKDNNIINENNDNNINENILQLNNYNHNIMNEIRLESNDDIENMDELIRLTEDLPEDDINQP